MNTKASRIPARAELNALARMDRVADGAELPTGHPMLALSERIRREREGNHGRLTTEISLALLITAWNAYRAGRSLQKAQLPKGGLNNDTFPTPR